MSEVSNVDAVVEDAKVALVEKTFNQKREIIIEALKLVGDDEIMAYAEELLKKAKKGGGIKKDSTFQIFKALLIEKGEINEFEMYMKFKAGKHESLTLCRQLRTRVPEGEEIIWAQDVEGKAVNPFTNEEEAVVVYKILGKGDVQPEAYVERRKKGAVPPKKDAVVDEVPSDDFQAELASGLDIH
jgi:hypothetical protein